MRRRVPPHLGYWVALVSISATALEIDHLPEGAREFLPHLFRMKFVHNAVAFWLLCLVSPIVAAPTDMGLVEREAAPEPGYGNYGKYGACSLLKYPFEPQ